MSIASVICKIASDRSLLCRTSALERLSSVCNRWLEHAAHYDDTARSRVIVAYNIVSLALDAGQPGCSREWLARASRWVASAQTSLRSGMVTTDHFPLRRVCMTLA